MRCKELAQLLSEYVDGALAPEQVTQLEQHLADCEPCQQALADLRETLALVQEIEPVAPPADLLQRIHAQIEAEATPAAATPARSRRLWCVLSTPQLRFAAAASLLALLSVQALRHLGPGPEPFAPPIKPTVSDSKIHSETVAPPRQDVVLSRADEEPMADNVEVADELLMRAVELEQPLPKTPEANKAVLPDLKFSKGLDLGGGRALDAPVSPAKTVAPRRRETKAELDGAIWSQAKDTDKAKSVSDPGKLTRSRFSSAASAPAVSSPPTPETAAASLPAPPAAPSPSLSIEAPFDQIQEEATEERESRVTDDVMKELQAPRIETITVATTDPSAVMQQIARFTQEQKKRGPAADMSQARADISPALKLKDSEHDGSVLHARVPAERYEELVAALKALEQTTDDDKAVITVIITIVHP
jgi:hypothetical protein